MGTPHDVYSVCAADRIRGPSSLNPSRPREDIGQVAAESNAAGPDRTRAVMELAHARVQRALSLRERSDRRWARLPVRTLSIDRLGGGRTPSSPRNRERMTTTMPEHVRTILFNRVPEVTFAFWVIKILSTTTGETFADYLNVDLSLGLSITTWVMTGLLILALAAQFATKRYTSGIYWTVVVLISIVGTLITDNLTDVFGVELWVSTLIFSVLLAVTFGIWYYREKTLSIHTIFTRRREAFYWIAILCTFALGTAAGDLISEGLGLGYLFGTILFAALIGIIAIARFAFKANVVFCFWAAYVLTRPLGASIGDLLSQAPADGGLGIGATTTSVVFLVIIVGVATYLGIKVRRQRAEATASMAGQPELIAP